MRLVGKLLSFKHFYYHHQPLFLTVRSIKSMTDPPTKSALKKLEKEAQLAAKKALKKSTATVVTPATTADGKKSDPKKKPTPAVEDPDPEFIAVPEGHKKDLTQRMASGYNPTDVEQSWYSWWRDSSYFVPAVPSENPSEYSFFDPKPTVLKRNEDGSVVEEDYAKVNKDKVFVIPAPPPNVTGSLHIGHALAFGLQDTLIRWCVLFACCSVHTLAFANVDHLLRQA